MPCQLLQLARYRVSVNIILQVTLKLVFGLDNFKLRKKKGYTTGLLLTLKTVGQNMCYTGKKDKAIPITGREGP
jgi:hypothetical protein